MQPLRSLFLGFNHLSGPIPPQWTSLTALSYCQLTDNPSLCGPLPPSWQGNGTAISPGFTTLSQIQGTRIGDSTTGCPLEPASIPSPLPDWADVLISLKETAWANSSSFSSWNATNAPCTLWAGELSQPRSSHKHSIYTTISLCLSPQGLLVIQSLGFLTYWICPVKSCTPAQRSPTACPSSRPSQESPSSPTQ